MSIWALLFLMQTFVAKEPMLVVHEGPAEEILTLMPEHPCTESLVVHKVPVYNNDPRNYPAWQYAQCHSPRYVYVSLNGGGYVIVDREARETRE